MKVNFLLFTIAALFISCSKDLGPEETLREFINYRFNTGQSKSKVLSYLEETIKEETEQFLFINEQELTAEEVEKKNKEIELFLNPEGYKKRDFKILHKNCNETRCFITYSLAYTQGGSENDSLTEVKKIAEIKVFDKEWKIVDITNVKTYIEGKKTITN